MVLIMAMVTLLVTAMIVATVLVWCSCGDGVDHDTANLTSNCNDIGNGFSPIQHVRCRRTFASQHQLQL